MSQPVLSGEKLAVEVKDGVLRVSNDPGFTSDSDPLCPYRAVWLRGPQGDTRFGRDLGKSTPIEARWDAFFASRSDLAALRLNVSDLSPATYTIRVYGGTHSRYVQADGTVAYDVIEWGDRRTNQDGSVTVNEVTFTVAAPAPPPPPPPAPKPTTETLWQNEKRAADVLYELVEQWRRVGDTDKAIADTLHYQLIKSLLTTNTKKRVELKNAIRSVLG